MANVVLSGFSGSGLLQSWTLLGIWVIVNPDKYLSKPSRYICLYLNR